MGKTAYRYVAITCVLVLASLGLGCSGDTAEFSNTGGSAGSGIGAGGIGGETTGGGGSGGEATGGGGTGGQTTGGGGTGGQTTGGGGTGGQTTGGGGTGGDVGGGTVGGGGSGGGTGGSGGGCAIDCGTVQTPECQVSVCNLGQFPGPIGECVTVDEVDGLTCDDGLFCTVGETCSGGSCGGGSVNDCGLTSGECEAVSCDENGQTCTTAPLPNGLGCTSTDLCEVNAVCTNGLCIGAPKDCSLAPVGECNIASCDQGTGQCVGAPDPGKNGLPCVQSGDVCMDGKTCLDGACQGGNPKDCSALDAECVAGACDQNTGQCVAQDIPQGNPCPEATDECNQGNCDANAVCVGTPLPNGSPCSDFSNCTTGDICTAGVCDGNPVVNCTTYFQDSFENGCPPAGWVLNPDWECGFPTVGPAAPFDGNNVIGTVLDAFYNPDNAFGTSYAQTPPIQLSAATEPVLAYHHFVDSEGSVYDGYNVKVSTDGGVNFAVLGTVDPPYNLTIQGEPAYGGNQAAANWQQVTADLSAFIGQTIVVRFDFRSDFTVQRDGIFIDAVGVHEAAAVPLLITTVSLPNAYDGFPYAAQLTRTGGLAAALWSIVGGSNHTWLSIDPASGLMTGTPGPANVGPVTVTVHIEEPALPANFDEQTFSFGVASAVYFEDFEGACPNAWSFGGDWQCGTPSNVGPAAAFSGSQCIATQLAANYNNNQAFGVATATSPLIDLAGTTAPLAAFRLWLNSEGSIYDGFNLKVSTDGVTFNLVNAVAPPYPLTIDTQPAWGGDQSALGWQEFTADLSAYAGAAVYLQLDFRSDSSVNRPGVYIDDFLVAD